MPLVLPSPRLLADADVDVDDDSALVASVPVHRPRDVDVADSNYYDHQSTDGNDTYILQAPSQQAVAEESPWPEPSSSRRLSVQPGELLVVVLVLAAWQSAVGLFLHKWREIRLTAPVGSGNVLLGRAEPKNLHTITIVKSPRESVIHVEPRPDWRRLSSKRRNARIVGRRNTAPSLVGPSPCVSPPLADGGGACLRPATITEDDQGSDKTTETRDDPRTPRPLARRQTEPVLGTIAEYGGIL